METWHSYNKISLNIFGLLVCLLLTASLSGCDQSPRTIFQGYVEGEFTYISAETAGKIEKILVERGQQVSVGQKLVILDAEQQLKQLAIENKKLESERATLDDLNKGQRPQELSVINAQIAQARHEAQTAASKLMRYRKIKKQGYVSDFELQQIESESQQKNARVNELLSQLASHKLPSRSDQILAQHARMESVKEELGKSKVDLDKRSLFSSVPGNIYDVMYHAGEVITPGQPILSLLAEDALKVRFFVPNKQLASLAVGQQIKIWIDGLDKPILAEIRFISPKAEYTPPVIYSKDQRERMVFMIEAVPFGYVQTLKLGQPVEVEL